MSDLVVAVDHGDSGIARYFSIRRRSRCRGCGWQQCVDARGVARRRGPRRSDAREARGSEPRERLRYDRIALGDRRRGEDQAAPRRGRARERRGSDPARRRLELAVGRDGRSRVSSGASCRGAVRDTPARGLARASRRPRSCCSPTARIHARKAHSSSPLRTAPPRRSRSCSTTAHRLIRRRRFGMTPLMWAAQMGHADTLVLLLTRGADPDVVEAFNRSTALMQAASSERADATIVTSASTRMREPISSTTKARARSTGRSGAGIRTSSTDRRARDRATARPRAHAACRPRPHRHRETPSRERFRYSSKHVPRGAASPDVRRAITMRCPRSRSSMPCTMAWRSTPRRERSSQRDRRVLPSAARQVPRGDRVRRCRRVRVPARRARRERLSRRRHHRRDGALPRAPSGRRRPDPAMIHPSRPMAATSRSRRSRSARWRRTHRIRRGLHALARTSRASTRRRPRTGFISFLGLHWTGSQSADLAPLAAKLVATQRDDGGFAQLAGLRSDAYATGQAIVALREAAALPASDPAIQRAVKFLLAHQYKDGSWFVATRRCGSSRSSSAASHTAARSSRRLPAPRGRSWHSATRSQLSLLRRLAASGAARRASRDSPRGSNCSSRCAFAASLLARLACSLGVREAGLADLPATAAVTPRTRSARTSLVIPVSAGTAARFAARSRDIFSAGAPVAVSI